MKLLALFIPILSLCLPLMGQAQDTSLQDLVNRKQYAAVLAYADQLTPADSADYPMMNAIAQAYEGVLKYRDAYSCYRHCLALDTTNIDVLNALARTATSLGKASDAERYYTKVLVADSTDFYANFQLGRLYYQLGNYDKAIRKYEYLLKNDGQNVTLLRNVGDCYMKAENGTSAIAAYFLAYQHNKENVGLASTLVNTLLQLGVEIKDAIAVCDTALTYNPGNRLIRQNKGMALYMNKQYADADTLYSDLLAEGDSSFLTVKYGGVSRYYAGQYLRSIDLLELAYRRDTTSADVCMLLGSVLGKTYDRKQAYVLLDKAEENMQPKEFLVNQLYLFRGETLQRDGRYNEASQMYYELWQRTGKERMNLLSTISNLYSGKASQYKDEDAKRRALFANVLYVKEFLQKGEDTKNMFFKRNLLESYLEDMFFRSITEETMIAPDGKKSKITDKELRELANQLPEMPEKVKQEIEKAQNAAIQQKRDTTKQS